MDDRIHLDKEKVALVLKQLEAFFVGMEATHESKSTGCFSGAYEKAESLSNRRKYSYLGSNMVIHFINFDFFYNTNIDFLFYS